MRAVINNKPAQLLGQHGLLQQSVTKYAQAAMLSTLAFFYGCNAFAQSFPVKDKTITIVVPFTAGGPTDRLARDMAEALRKPLGVNSVVVENILGAGGAIATQKVARAAPDGHTILIHHIGMATMPSLNRLSLIHI